MNSLLLYNLEKCETDIDGALERFMGNDELYESCLNSFLSDNTMMDLELAIDSQSWDDAFTAAHALKGLAGNMGFVPLYHSLGDFVVVIRKGRTEAILDSLKKVRQNYDRIVYCINQANLV